MPKTVAKKSLGQHWLDDEPTLLKICQAADLTKDDTVLEIGPGQGSLTKHLLKRAGHVIAVELDSTLAKNLSRHVSLPSEVEPWKGELQVVQGDILKFDLTQLPPDYKAVANIPYYLTSALLRMLCESQNPPKQMVLLVQKEVAQRICAEAGQMSVLSISVQLFYECQLGQVVPAKLFTPAPKVDSQVVILKRREVPLFEDLDSKLFFRVVKAGFSSRRKMLRSSLSGGLRISKQQADNFLSGAGIDGDRRAQELDLRQWDNLYKTYKSNLPHS